MEDPHWTVYGTELHLGSFASLIIAAVRKDLAGSDL